MKPPRPEANDGPRHFFSNWLIFNENRPTRMRTMGKLIATVVILLAASALLALFSGHLQR